MAVRDRESGGEGAERQHIPSAAYLSNLQSPGTVVPGEMLRNVAVEAIVFAEGDRHAVKAAVADNSDAICSNEQLACG